MRFAAPAREVADAAHVAGALLHADHAAGLQQVEDVACLHRLFIGGDRYVIGERVLALGLGLVEQVEQRVGLGDFEVPFRHLLLVLEEDVAIAHVRDR